MALKMANKGGEEKPFKFEKKGDTIKGYYQGRTTITIGDRPVVKHTYKTSDGTLSVLGQAGILKQYEENNIKPGMLVNIVFTGKALKLKGGKTMKVYDVLFDAEDVDSNVSAPVDTTSEPEEESDENYEFRTRGDIETSDDTTTRFTHTPSTTTKTISDLLASRKNASRTA